MRSIKQIDRKISIGGMVIGRWYKVTTINNNTYIFKFNGIHGDSIGRVYSVCLNDLTYEQPGFSSVCRVFHVCELYSISKVEVLKYFDEGKL